MKSIGNKNHNKKMNNNNKPNIINKTNYNFKGKNNTYPNDILGLFRRLGIE
jgi:hypothetical protein